MGKLDRLTVVGLALPGGLVGLPGFDGDGLRLVEGEGVRRGGAEPRVLFPGGKDPQTDHFPRIQTGQVQGGLALGGVEGLGGSVPRIRHGNGRTADNVLYAPDSGVFQRDGHHTPVGQRGGGDLRHRVDIRLPVQDDGGIGVAAGKCHRVYLMELFRTPERDAAPAVGGGQEAFAAAQLQLDAGRDDGMIFFAQNLNLCGNQTADRVRQRLHAEIALRVNRVRTAAAQFAGFQHTGTLHGQAAVIDQPIQREPSAQPQGQAGGRVEDHLAESAASFRTEGGHSAQGQTAAGAG